MPVDSKQGYGKMHEGRLYRFCSRDCLDRFDETPMAFLKPPRQLPGGES
jgi:YHS domain-containing protein